MELFYLPKDLYNEIQKCIDPSGNIYDHASPELYRLRRQINAIEVNMRKKIEALKLQNKDYLSHDVISTRNDHFVLPVNVSIKIKLKEFNMDILLQEEQPMLNQKPLWLITIN
ncbi:MAG TPA: hypothetical protein OIL95_03050 [Coprobacillaceae bacterium]|nr:hypothetical protein [Coprobacillaceae bacterium]